MLEVDQEAPELCSRTAFWIESFNLLCRTRQASMGSILPLNPVVIMDMADRMEWPCEYRECVEVITGLDDTYRELNQDSK